MKFEKAYIVGAREMGLSNKLTNYGFLAFLEDVASTHSDTVGYGVKDIETKKRAWLLMDWNLRVLKRPSFGEELLAKTWATPIDKPTFSVYRNFEITNAQNDLIATATSKWVLFDVENNKIAKIDNNLISMYSPEGLVEPIDRLKEPASFESIFEYTIKRADIDINRHVHNLNYLSLAYEALPDEIYNREELNNVHIMYKHQIKLGDNVKCFYHCENDEHYITIKSQNEKILHAIVKLW